jgi:hypothetical protein
LWAGVQYTPSLAAARSSRAVTSPECPSPLLPPTPPSLPPNPALKYYVVIRTPFVPQGKRRTERLLTSYLFAYSTMFSSFTGSVKILWALTYICEAVQ